MIADRDDPTPPPPARPRRRKPSRRPRCAICPSCGHSIEINYCTKCGQHAAEHNASVWGFIAEFFDEFLRLDSKFLRTMAALIIKPGFLTKEWCAGKRSLYISPLKLYLTISALFFLGVGYRVGPTTDKNSTLHVNVNGKDETNLDAIGKAIRGETIPRKQSNFDQKIDEMVSHLHNVDAKATRDYFFNHISTASLILVPVSAFFFSALYIGKKRYYLEHLVFMLHVSSFSFVTMGIAMFISHPAASPIAFLWNVGYLFFAIKKNYEQGWIVTFIKFWLFSTALFVLVVMAITLTAVAAAFMSKMQSPASPATSKPAASSGKTSEALKPIEAKPR